jgi:hypothetical protein
MKKLKYLLLGFLLSIALLFGGCEVLNETVEWGEELSEEQNSDKKEDGDSSLEGTADLPVSDESQNETDDNANDEDSVTYGESYTSKEEVALYLHLYEELPPNFITKNKAKKLGWDSKKGNLSKVAPGMSIGGDHFGNYEGVLPKGKDYRECDIDTDGSYRGAKRIVFSDDGCIYYTEDHYESFELLYGEE